MNTTLKFFGKFLFALLALSSGSFSYGFPLSEIRQEKKDSRAQLHGTQPLLLAFQEKEYQDIPDPSEDFIFGFIQAGYSSFTPYEEKEFQSFFSFYHRDLRAEISTQIFPTHFFL